MPHITRVVRKVLEWQRCTHNDELLLCPRCGALLAPKPNHDRTLVLLSCSQDGCTYVLHEVPEDVLTADLEHCPETRPLTFA